MRKLQKDLTLAIVYKKWLSNLEKRGAIHPEYKSSYKFYKDIVGNLLWVQKGLCAYTEMYLVNPQVVEPANWKNGVIDKFEFLGHLDHYNSSLKKKKGWLWDNFFVVHSDVNVKLKGQKKVNGILKPDNKHYNPFYYLEYDFKTHNFLPNRNRTDTIQDKVLDDINTLGLNYKPIIDYRREYLKPIIDDVLLKQVNLIDAKKRLIKFYTAFEMIVESLGLKTD